MSDAEKNLNLYYTEPELARFLVAMCLSFLGKFHFLQKPSVSSFHSSAVKELIEYKSRLTNIKWNRQTGNQLQTMREVSEF